MPSNARQKITKVFHIDYTSEIDDARYQGAFTTKKLSIQTRAKMGVVKAQLSGGMHYDSERPGYGIDSTTDDFNAILAHITVALTDTPNWWNLDDIGDLNIIYEVYKEVAEHENSFRKRAEKQEAGADGQGDSSSADRQSDGSGAVSTVVDKEVQSALEP